MINYALILWLIFTTIRDQIMNYIVNFEGQLWELLNGEWIPANVPMLSTNELQPPLALTADNRIYHLGKNQYVFELAGPFKALIRCNNKYRALNYQGQLCELTLKNLNDYAIIAENIKHLGIIKDECVAINSNEQNPNCKHQNIKYGQWDIPGYIRPNIIGTRNRIAIFEDCISYKVGSKGAIGYGIVRINKMEGMIAFQSMINRLSGSWYVIVIADTGQIRLWTSTLLFRY